MKRYLPSPKTVWIPFILSLAFAGLILYLGFEHNPQYEFYDQHAGVDWKYSIKVGSICFIEAYLFFFLISYVIEILWKAEGHLVKSDHSGDEEGSIKRNGPPAR